MKLRTIWLISPKYLHLSHITGTYYLGGIVGYAENSTIDNCVSDVTFSGTTNPYQRGGIAGYAKSSTFTGCVNENTVSGSYSIGGIVGYGETWLISPKYLHLSHIKRVIVVGENGHVHVHDLQ